MKAKDLRFGTLNPISENTSTHGGDRRRTTTVTSINRALDKAYEKDTLLGVNEFNGIVVFSRLKTYPTYKNRSSLLQEYTIAADADGLAGARPAGHDGGDEEEEEAELVTQEYDNIAYKVYIPELDPRPAPDGTDCTLLRTYSDVYSDIKTEIPLGSIVVVRYEDKESLFNPRIIRVMEGPIRIDGVSWDPAEQKPLEHSFINGNTTSTVGSATIPGAIEECPDTPSGILDEEIVVSTIVPDAYGGHIRGKESFIRMVEVAYQNLVNQGIYISIGDSWRSYDFQKSAYLTKGQPGQEKAGLIAHPCKGYHVQGQAIDIEQTVAQRDDILAHGPIYQAFYDAGLRRISNEYWHWSVGETQHPRNKMFARSRSGKSPADTFVG